MSVKGMNFKMEEDEILDMKHVAAVFNMSVTDLIKNAIKEYIAKLKKDPFYRLTANVREADEDESREILDVIDGMSDDDLTISTVKHFTV